MVAEMGAPDDPRSPEYLNLVQVPENRQSAPSGQCRLRPFYMGFSP
jgi:hypothetical protein